MKATVGAFPVIVKLQTSQRFVSSSSVVCSVVSGGNVDMRMCAGLVPGGGAGA